MLIFAGKEFSFKNDEPSPFGDPPPGRSALDQKRAEEERAKNSAIIPPLKPPSLEERRTTARWAAEWVYRNYKNKDNKPRRLRGV